MIQVEPGTHGPACPGLSYTPPRAVPSPWSGPWIVARVGIILCRGVLRATRPFLSPASWEGMRQATLGRFYGELLDLFLTCQVVEPRCDLCADVAFAEWTRHRDHLQAVAFPGIIAPGPLAAWNAEVDGKIRWVRAITQRDFMQRDLAQLTRPSPLGTPGTTP